jgi:hypothetical protein
MKGKFRIVAYTPRGKFVSGTFSYKEYDGVLNLLKSTEDLAYLTLRNPPIEWVIRKDALEASVLELRPTLITRIRRFLFGL